MAKLLEGRPIAVKIQDKIIAKLNEIKTAGLTPPSMVSIQTSDDSSSAWYIGQQEKLAAKLGIGFRKIPASEVTGEVALIKKVREINSDTSIHGLFVSMPFPKDVNADSVLLAMDPKKDIEGVHPTSLGLIVLRRGRLIPPTAFSAFTLIKSSGVSLRGKKAVLIGQSAIIGRPLQLLLGEARAATFVCNTGTSEEDMKKIIVDSDIVVACSGQPKMIKGEWIKPDAIVVDVGTTEVNGKLVGDVEFEEARKQAAFITPVPGGVGPLTVTMLMENLMTAYDWQRE